MSLKSAVFLFAILATLFISAYSVPIDLEEELDAVPEGHVITKRATCDLLNFEIGGFKVNDSACAAHCIALRKGFKGGHCNKNKVCVCRK